MAKLKEILFNIATYLAPSASSIRTWLSYGPWWRSGYVR